MRPLKALLVYITVVFAGGALLAPWLYALAYWGAEHMAWLRPLANNPFHRFVHRSILFLAVLGLWPLLRYLGVKNWRDVGFIKSNGLWPRLMLGFALGLGSLALVVIVTLLGSVRKLDLSHNLTEYLGHLVKAGGAAFVAGLLEEVIFRGVLFGALRRSMRWPLALGWSSLLYAWLHFFEKPASPPQVIWVSGLELLPQMMRGFVEISALIPGFLNLTWAGALLALAYQRTGNLYFSIGLHAGWIFWLKTYAYLTQPMGNGTVWFWGTNKLVDGWLALLILGVTGWVLARRVLPAIAVQSQNDGGSRTIPPATK